MYTVWCCWYDLLDLSVYVNEPDSATVYVQAVCICMHFLLTSPNTVLNITLGPFTLFLFCCAAHNQYGERWELFCVKLHLSCSCLEFRSCQHVCGFFKNVFILTNVVSSVQFYPFIDTLLDFSIITNWVFEEEKNSFRVESFRKLCYAICVHEEKEGISALSLLHDVISCVWHLAMWLYVLSNSWYTADRTKIVVVLTFLQDFVHVYV